MEVMCSPETSVGFQRSTWRYISQDSTLQIKRPLPAVPSWINNHIETEMKTWHLLEIIIFSLFIIHSFSQFNLYTLIHWCAIIYCFKFLSIYLSNHLSIYESTVLWLDLGRFFTFLILYTARRLLGRGISPSQGRYLHTEQHKQYKSTQTSIPRVGLEPTIPVFEWAKIRG
jgi:hypothetical protein